MKERPCQVWSKFSAMLRAKGGRGAGVGSHKDSMWRANPGVERMVGRGQEGSRAKLPLVGEISSDRLLGRGGGRATLDSERASSSSTQR